MLAGDRQARHGLAAPCLIGKTAKEHRATMGDKPVIGLFGVGLEEPYRWKDSASPAAPRFASGCYCQRHAPVAQQILRYSP
jgi:hypothetical protein